MGFIRTYAEAPPETSASLLFDGSDDYIQVNHSGLHPSGAFTFFCRFNVATGSRGMFLSTGWGFSSGINVGVYHGGGSKPGGIVFGTSANTSFESDNDYNDNENHYVFATFDSGAEITIITDEETKTASVTQTSVSGTDNFILGRANTFGDYYVDGTLWDVRFWHKALSEAERNTVLTGATEGSEEFLLPLNDGTGTTANDLSDNDNDGTLHNFADPATSDSGWQTS